MNWLVLLVAYFPVDFFLVFFSFLTVYFSLVADNLGLSQPFGSVCGQKIASSFLTIICLSFPLALKKQSKNADLFVTGCSDQMYPTPHICFMGLWLLSCCILVSS